MEKQDILSWTTAVSPVANLCMQIFRLCEPDGSENRITVFLRVRENYAEPIEKNAHFGPETQILIYAFHANTNSIEIHIDSII